MDVFFEVYVQPIELPHRPPKGSVYYANLPIDPDSIDRSDINHIYTLFQRTYTKPSFIRRRGSGGVKDKPAPFERAITQQDLNELVVALAYQETIPVRYIDSIMSSKIAFSEEISRKDFSKAFIDGIQQVECAGFYGMMAMAVATQRAFSRSPVVIDRYLGILNSMKSGSYCFSGAYFKCGHFEKNPLTPDEILALPYLFDYAKDLYNLLGISFESHRESVVNKLLDAGFEEEASILKVA